MKRIAVIGCPGSGKSCFARELGKVTGLPVIHLDQYYHQSVWSSDPELKTSEWRAKVSELVAGEDWIIDGNYSGTFDIRFKCADTIIFLDFPRWLSMIGLFKRQLMYRNKPRPDMPPEWKEHIEWEFLLYVWSFRTRNRPKINAWLTEVKSAGKQVLVFKQRSQVSNLLASIVPK